jgi:hypothetical protein
MAAGAVTDGEGEYPMGLVRAGERAGVVGGWAGRGGGGGGGVGG